MRRFATVIAIAALALGCRAIPPREPATPEPPPRDRVAPAGECAVEPVAPPAPAPRSEAMAVTATAYNSLPEQGVGRGLRGAWGDRLSPGMKTIAVSHDLIALGLTRGAVVRIEGLEGEYTVLDRLPRHWKKRIDIYMGKDVRAARAWGRRVVRITVGEEIADEPVAPPASRR
jgi:3D (Asp-Asp-Asp) domain-containing protein